LKEGEFGGGVFDYAQTPKNSQWNTEQRVT